MAKYKYEQPKVKNKMPSIYNPSQVVLVTSRAEIDIIGKEVVKDDIITLSWHMPVSFDPAIYAVAIGKSKFSAKLIGKSGVFVVNFIPQTLEKQAIFCGTHHGEHMDKFRETGLTREEAEKIECPRIKEALAYIECELVNTVEAGDHYIFIGKVVNSAERGQGKRLFQKPSATGYKFTTTV